MTMLDEIGDRLDTWHANGRVTPAESEAPRLMVLLLHGQVVMRGPHHACINRMRWEGGGDAYVALLRGWRLHEADGTEPHQRPPAG